jgi:predicted DNA-binding transcriptional regulator YafY
VTVLIVSTESDRIVATKLEGEAAELIADAMHELEETVEPVTDTAESVQADAERAELSFDDELEQELEARQGKVSLPSEPVVVGLGTANAELLQQAIDSGFVVSFDYNAQESKVWSKRVFSPWEIIPRLPGHDHRAAVLGFDHVRQAIRRFSLERIEDLTLEVAYDYQQPEGGE